jgi:hypothetical protein
MSEDEDYVAPADLRFLLNQIIKNFAGDEKRMRRVRSTLLHLMREFARREVKRLRRKR